PRAGEHAGGDGEVEGGALLGQLGRGQVDGQLPLREVETGVANRSLDPLPGLLDRPIGQPDDGEARYSRRDIRLDDDGHAGETAQGTARRGGEHTQTSVSRR